jgi:hypothetical protein
VKDESNPHSELDVPATVAGQKAKRDTRFRMALRRPDWHRAGQLMIQAMIAKAR